MSGQQENKIEFNPKADATVLGKILQDEYGISSEGKNKASIVKALKAKGAVAVEVESQSLEDANVSIQEEIEESAKEDGDGEFVTAKVPKTCKIIVGEEPNNPNDFVCKLNGKTYQIERDVEVTVPWGLVKHLQTATKKISYSEKVDGQTRSFTKLSSAYPFIQMRGIAEYEERKMPKKLYEALKEKGEL